MGTEPGFPDRIVDAAFALAETQGWHDVSLNDVAAKLGVGLPAIAQAFRDRDAIADAWFARALAAMLAVPDEERALAPSARAAACMLRWFAAQQAHAGVAGQVLATRLWPSHPHHWLPMVFSLSRLVHWWLDAAGIEHTGPRRMAEEVRLTAIVLRLLAAWQVDARNNQAHSLPRVRSFLDRRLDWLDR